MIEPLPAGAAGAGAGARGLRIPRRGHLRLRDLATHGHAVHGEPLAPSVVRLDQRAHGAPAVRPGSRRDAVPVPPLNSWQIIPVPPPTLPSGTGPSLAASNAASRCSGRRGSR